MKLRNKSLKNKKNEDQIWYKYKIQQNAKWWNWKKIIQNK
jgi:hypothetical protein